MNKNFDFKDFEMLEHTADIKVRVYGTDLPEFFRHALIAMFQVAQPRISGCETQTTKFGERVVCPQLPVSHEISLVSPNKESLLVDFLSHALCLSDIHDEAYLDATIHMVTDTTIDATLHGIRVDRFEVVEIKAVTYHDLEIVQTKDGWQADIVFDI